MIDPFDDFRRIYAERSQLAVDCRTLGGVVLRRSRATGFSGEDRVEVEGGDVNASGFDTWGDEHLSEEGRAH